MNKIKLLCLALIVGLSFGCACPMCHSKATASAPVLRHVVMFQFTADTTPDQLQEIEANFRALPTKIPGIVGFEWGTNISPENKNQGLTHCFFLTFASLADRDAYLPHPAHKAFGASLKGHVEKVCVLDYWAKP